MPFVLKKKYHIAVMDSDKTFLTKMSSALTKWYNKRVVVKTYDNEKEMFEAINISKSSKNPFDLAILGADELAEKMVLRQIDPGLTVFLCDGEASLKKKASQFLL